MNGDNVTYCDSFGVEHNPKEIKKFVSNRNITINTFRVQAYDSVMCRYFSIRFIDFMLRGKSFLVYSNLFSPNNSEKNDKIIVKDFQ